MQVGKSEGAKKQEKIKALPQEQVDPAKVADDRLRNELKPVSVKYEKEVPKELKVEDIDFTAFAKGKRDAAAAVVSMVLANVKQMAKDYNYNYPCVPYFPDYENFPVPENFNPKNYGGKDEAYYTWETSVRAWENNVKDDIKKLNTQSESQKMFGLQRQIYEGFINVYTQLGLNREQINEVCKHFAGNQVEIKNALNQMRDQIRQEGAFTRATVVVDGHITRGRVVAENLETRATVRDEAADAVSDIRETVRNEVHGAREAVLQNMNELSAEEKSPN